ncbi:hypothetical protein K440DRAFT_619345 [Wilcoxina mikolae CBS 423.85]|nr:hypothetical protein K440DRAFT_619345 [Wilcoxina mikolae CBS 423.85]
MPKFRVDQRVEYREERGAKTRTGVIKRIRFDSGTSGPFKYEIKPDETGRPNHLVSEDNVVRAL